MERTINYIKNRQENFLEDLNDVDYYNIKNDMYSIFHRWHDLDPDLKAKQRICSAY